MSISQNEGCHRTFTTEEALAQHQVEVESRTCNTYAEENSSALAAETNTTMPAISFGAREMIFSRIVIMLKNIKFLIYLCNRTECNE